MKLKQIHLIVFLLTQVILKPAFSDEVGTSAEEPLEENELEYLLKPFEDDFFDFLDTPHEIISEGVEAAAQGMDLFFADEKIYHETTSSYARLSTQVNFNHGGEYTTTGDLHLKVDLKETKKKLKLLLKSDSDRDIQTGINSNTTPGQPKETVNFYAALQKEISKKHEWSTKASLGVKLKVPLDPFFYVRANKDFDVAPWKIHFSENLFWFNSKGAGASSLLEVDYPLTKRLLFRSTTSELWTDFLDYHEGSQVFSLYHEITDRRAISYSIGVNGTSKPNIHRDSYFTSINYRQRIHRDWLFLDISPAISYARSNNYQANRSLTMRLEMVFGNQYVYRPPTGN